MSNDPKERPDHFEAPAYFEASAKGAQAVIYSIISHLFDRIEIGGPKRISILDRSLEYLDKYAEEQKAERMPLLIPFGGVNFLSHTESTMKTLKVKDVSCESVWNFDKKVYAGNILFFHSDYEELGWACGSFIVSGSDAEAKEFLQNYYQSKWKNDAGPKVLDYHGNLIDSFRHMQWEDIFLPNNMGTNIRTEIETFFENEAQYKKHGLDWKRGIMLAGTPGNGKTAICRAVATTSKVPVIYCTLDDNDSFRVLARVDKTIRAHAPCIIIFEDADSLATNPQARSNILNLLDGLLSVPGTFTIASTNMPDKLDEAFTGRPSRFDSFYIIGDPEPVERKRIFEARLGQNMNGIPPEEIEKLIKDMAGLSAACVQEVAVCALLENFKTNKPIDVDMLRTALTKVKKHMKASDAGVQKILRGSMGFGNTKEDDHEF